MLQSLPGNLLRKPGVSEGFIRQRTKTRAEGEEKNTQLIPLSSEVQDDTWLMYDHKREESLRHNLPRRTEHQRGKKKLVFQLSLPFILQNSLGNIYFFVLSL